ncbi:MAG: NAD(P)H-dependent oxidoreductase subunit E [Anaerolineales bacterium]
MSEIASLIQPYLPQGRSGLLPALQRIQAEYGWISQEQAAEIARLLHVPLAEVHGVIEFYDLLHNKPRKKKTLHLCTDVACALRGADTLVQELGAGRPLGTSGPTLDGNIEIEQSPCLGLCDRAPAMLLEDGQIWQIGTPEGNWSTRPRTFIGGSVHRLTARCGNGQAASLSTYGGYRAWKRAQALSPQQVIEEVKASGLFGRGGAAFPTGLKWEGAARAEGSPKYVVCNADESEPGTFKDRILLSDDPHLVLEGMRIAAYAIGATKGYVYLRGEYAYLRPILEKAIAEAEEAGLLAGFEIELRLGAGAYICGEETALFESIEGKRGFPRLKPPFPTTHGLFGKPTIINNVETLANVPFIIEHGAAAYRQLGSEKSPGSKLFCLSGDVARPGLYEVPFGMRLGELLEMAGGVPEGRNIQAILLGGAAGTFATPRHLDLRLTVEDLRQAGLVLGSGVVMVFDERRDLRRVLLNIARFFAHESCGKCYPCQMGTQRQMEILERLAQGHLLPGDRERLEDIGWTMSDASLCGLGQTAASALLSAIQQWPSLFV